jgi:predicted kinase
MNKVLILVRGVSGSGKTTLTENFLKIDKWLSTDDYFYNPLTGKYQFDPKLLSSYHHRCKMDTQTWMKKGKRIAVHNTFTQEWELKPYLDLAKKWDYPVITLVVEKRHKNKSVHDVPEDVIQAQTDRFEIQL